MSVPGSDLCRQEKSYRLYLVFGVSKNKVRKPERRRGVSFGVQDDESQQGSGRWGRGSDPKVKAAKIKHDVCRLCRGGDSLSVCSRFRSMSPGEKLSFVWGKSFASAVLMVDMLQVSAERVLYVAWKGVPKSIPNYCTNPLCVQRRRTLENSRRLLIQELAVTLLRAIPMLAAHQDKDRPN